MRIFYISEVGHSIPFLPSLFLILFGESRDTDWTTRKKNTEELCEVLCTAQIGIAVESKRIKLGLEKLPIVQTRNHTTKQDSHLETLEYE